MSTVVREIKLERTIIYRLNLAEARLLKDLVRQLTGSSSFTGRITIDCCTGGIGEVSSRGAGLVEKDLTHPSGCDNPSIVLSEPTSSVV